MDAIERAAKAAHDKYEEYAPMVGYETKKESRVPWEDLPEHHQHLMCVSTKAAIRAYLKDAPGRLNSKRMICQHRDIPAMGIVAHAEYTAGWDAAVAELAQEVE